MVNKHSKAVIIPTFNEWDTLPILLRELSLRLTSGDIIVIADDSDPRNRHHLKTVCASSIENIDIQLIFSFADVKGGRGSAVRRGMKLVFENYSDINSYIECDADSSHRVEDIIKVSLEHTRQEVVIGSRYLKLSSIVGWPLSRRAFSKVLNVVIPKILMIDVSDITNGLRRYDRNAVEILLNYPITNTGFTYLSEQILILARNGYGVVEVPTVFINRTIGSSTVTWREVYHSLTGLLKLLGNKRKLFITTE